MKASEQAWPTLKPGSGATAAVSAPFASRPITKLWPERYRSDQGRGKEAAVAPPLNVLGLYDQVRMKEMAGAANWMPLDDRSLNDSDRHFKEERLNNWVRDLQRHESTECLSGDDKDEFVLVRTSEVRAPVLEDTNGRGPRALPIGEDPNEGNRTYPRGASTQWRYTQFEPRDLKQAKLLNTGTTDDPRGSVAPVYDVTSLHYDVANEERQCPVCDMMFADIIPLAEYESHVADCCERSVSNKGPASPPSGPLISPPGPASEKCCPVCNHDYSIMSQRDFVNHVQAHFHDDEQTDQIDDVALETNFELVDRQV